MVSHTFPELEELKRRLGLSEEQREDEPPVLVDVDREEGASAPTSPLAAEEEGERDEGGGASGRGLGKARRALSMISLSFRDVTRTAEDYRRQAMLEAMLLSGINISEVLGGGGGTPLYAGQEIGADEVLGAVGPEVGDLRAVINHVTWISDGKNRAMLIVVSFVRGGKVIDETVITARSSEEARNAIRVLLQRAAQRIAHGSRGGGL